MRILELFAGIGAVAQATDQRHTIAAAVDINENAKAVYEANFSHRYLTKEIASLSDQEFAEFKADLWWMSPPCQPFTRRGNQRDIDDPRAQPMLRVFDAIESVKPTCVALENVVGFEKSQAWEKLKKVFASAGYHVTQIELCSSMFGLPNTRPRVFVLASRETAIAVPTRPSAEPRSLGEFLDSPAELSRWRSHLAVEPEIATDYLDGINLVHDESRSSRCFTSAYGNSHVQSGSYLEDSDYAQGIRRLSPSEMLRLLGFASDFRIPAELSARQLWKLVGNSISAPCVRHVLGCFQ